MACINTNFVPNQDTRLLMRMKMQSLEQTDNLGGRYCGCGYWNYLESMAFNFENGYLHIAWGGITYGWKDYYTVMVDTDIHVFDWDKNTFYIDNTLIDTEQQVTFTAPHPLGIFTFMTDYWSGGTVPSTYSSEYLPGRMYYFKIYDNGTLVRDLVPCINPSNVVGAYDIVNGVFYASENSGYTFTAGPQVPSKNWEDLSDIIATATTASTSGGKTIVPPLSGITFIKVTVAEKAASGVNCWITFGRNDDTSSEVFSLNNFSNNQSGGDRSANNLQTLASSPTADWIYWEDERHEAFIIDVAKCGGSGTDSYNMIKYQTNINLNTYAFQFL